MEILLPEFSGQMRIRPIGRAAGAVVFVFAVNQGAGAGESLPAAVTGPSLAQGIVWVDSKRAQPARLLYEVTSALPGAGQHRVDMKFLSVRFDTLDATLLLPAQVAFDVSKGPSRTHSVHRFSDFRLEGSGDAGVITAARLRRKTPWSG